MSVVTVAIPFSGEPSPYLEMAVRSVFSQTFDDWELILIGDNPRRDLLDLALAIRDARVTVVGDGVRRGLAFRLNQSIAMAATTFYARMDADDIMFRSRIERQHSALSQGGLDVVGARAVVIDDGGVPEGLLMESNFVPADINGFLRANAFTHPAVAGRTDWFMSNSYDEGIRRAEDKELWLRTFSSSRFGKDPDPGLFYRVARGFNRRKSVRTALDDAKVSLRGPAYGARWDRVASATLSSAGKAAVYGAVPSSYWHSLRRRRIEESSGDVLARWADELTKIGNTPVSGWE